jgi:sigma-B regulation protein RsbU (phosphoserine phosphatase)
MCPAGGPADGDRAPRDETTFSVLLEDSAEDLYENAPCGYLSTLMDGTIAKINATLLGWLGYTREDLVGRRRFADLLTVGGRIYHETHIAPSLSMHGEIGGLALELRAADGSRLPVLVTSVVKTGVDGAARLIRTTIFDARDRHAYEQELLRARQDADRERDNAQQLAATLQRTLLPPALPAVAGIDVASYYHPASTDQLGGDFYDLFPITGGSWGFFLGDVSGKGAGAAVVTSLIRYTLRAAAVYDADPITVLGTLNTVLGQENRATDPSYCTVIYGSLVPRTGGADITFASGGHPPAVLVRADGTTEVVETPGGMLVGALADARFTSVDLKLGPADTLLLYTDGLTEARTAGRTRYSEEQLHEFVTGLAPASASALVAALSDLLTGFDDGVDDDTALLALGVPA